MNRRDWELTQLPCSEPFGYWFSGFVDGEGCFSIEKRPFGYICRLIIKLRADDRAALELIRDELGLGLIHSGTHSGPGFGNPWVTWSVTKKKDLIPLTEVLDFFPLRTKKARDYALWRDAAIEWAIGSQPMNWGPIERAFHALRSVREYIDDEGLVPIETSNLLSRGSSKSHGNRLGFPSDRLGRGV